MFDLLAPVLSALALAVPMVIADHLTGTALWSHITTDTELGVNVTLDPQTTADYWAHYLAVTNQEDTTMSSTTRGADRFDIFPADDDELDSLAELASMDGEYDGLHILSDDELDAMSEDLDTVDDTDYQEYLEMVYVDPVEAYEYDQPCSVYFSR